MAFLTDIDPNAKVKGSRDPLGTLSVWTGFTRRVIGNLTSQTVLLDDFRVLVIGAWIEDQLAGTDVRPGDAFLVWEQLAAYSRLQIADQAGFRGVTRAKHFLREGEIRVSPDRRHQLLTNQSAYGVWGLYRAAGGRGGLLHDKRPAVRGTTASLVEHTYLPKLSKVWGPGAQGLLRWCAEGHDLSLTKHHSRLEAIAGCIDGPLDEREREVYRDLVLFGGPSSRDDDVPIYQEELARLLHGQVPENRSPGRDDVVALVPEASTVLAGRLADILACEDLLAPCMRLFSYVSQQSGQRLDGVVGSLDNHFAGAATLLRSSTLERLRAIRLHQPSLLRAPEEKVATESRWLAIAEALHAKDLSLLVNLLLQQNTAVSRDRGGTVGWISVSDSGVLDVHLADPGRELPEPEKVTGQWINGYFMSNLRAMSSPVLEAA